MSTPKINPMSLTPEDAAQLISKAGGEDVTEQEVRAAIEAGAPVDAQGNINLVYFGAWLLKEISDVN